MLKNMRNSSLDALKFFCIIGVVCIHTTPFTNMNVNLAFFKCLSNVINIIARVCVPLFFVISGYLFYNKCNADYTKRYVIKMIKIMVLWSSVYIIFGFVLENLDDLSNLKRIAIQFFEYLRQFKILDLYYGQGIVAGHLWYLSAIIVVIPCLYWTIEKNQLERIVCVSLILNVIGVAIPVIFGRELFYRVRDAVFLGLFYSSLGAYIHKYECEFKQKIKSIGKYEYFASIILLIGLTILEKFIYSAVFQGWGDYFLSTIPLTMLIFTGCLIKKDIFLGTFLNKIGENTLGIYLIHILIMPLISFTLTIFHLSWIRTTLVWQFVYTPIIVLTSYIVYEVIQKIILRGKRIAVKRAL